jgi:hypothetical protein
MRKQKRGKTAYVSSCFGVNFLSSAARIRNLMASARLENRCLNRKSSRRFSSSASITKCRKGFVLPIIHSLTGITGIDKWLSCAV